VHLHCRVPGGALADDGTWLPVKGSYLFPVRALSRHFRGRFVSALRSAAKAGELTGIDPGAVSALLDALIAEEWVVFAKPCLEHTESVIGYLARYTHRIAISNARILGLDGHKVQVSYRDYRDDERKILVLAAGEMIRRFLLHISAQGANAGAPLRAADQSLPGAAPGADPQAPSGPTARAGARGRARPQARARLALSGAPAWAHALGAQDCAASRGAGLRTLSLTLRRRPAR